MKSKSIKKSRVSPADIPVVVLAGGYGTRLMEETQVLPKPMVTIGGMPILLHIMRYYGSFGFKRFIVCVGYKGYVIKDYFLNLAKHTSSLVIDGKAGTTKYQPTELSDWNVSLIETGEHSLTATRLRNVGEHIRAPHFCLTYGDGLCDVALDRELAFHLGHGKMGTVVAVHYPSRFGKLDMTGEGRIRTFKEKQKLSHDYINGGYFIFRREFLERLSPRENQSLEQEPLTTLAGDGELYGYKHDGFWMCMDTLRDRRDLESVFDGGRAPWVRW